MSVLLAFLVVAAAPPAAPPSVAVLDLQAKGVDTNVADLVTAGLVTTLRDSGNFSRVVGTKDIEALLGFERQKQLLACDSSSCMAELAGALGVDLLVTGSLGKLGERHVLSLTLLSPAKAAALSSAMRTLAAEKEDTLLAEVPGVVDELLRKSGMAGLPEKMLRAAVPASTPVAADAGAKGGGIAGKALMGVGGAALAAGLLPTLVGLVAAGAASAIWMAALFVRVPMLQVVGAGYYALWVAAVVGAGLALLVGGTGAAVLVTGVVLR